MSSPSAREAAFVLERLPSLAAFGLPSPSSILLQSVRHTTEPLVPRPQVSVPFEPAPSPATGAPVSSFPQLRRGRPRLDRSSLRCAHCGSTESTQWRTSSLGPRTLCNACGLRAFRRKQREARDKDGDKKLQFDEHSSLPSRSPGASEEAAQPPAANPSRMSVSFLTS